MIIHLIVACEIMFWVFIAAGLAARYLLRKPTLGAALLICAPLVDVVLLVATALDLRGGGQANFSHGLAAAYIGVSVAFGHSLVAWADAQFSYRFAGGPRPVAPPKYGTPRALREWREFGKAALAWAISCGLLTVAIFLVDDAGRTEALEGWISNLTLVLGIWAVVALSYTLFPKREKLTARG
ncbi:hypothetical protein B2J88_20045 [Rhodococcus sp. SRB_17]|uniref:hypothetical protein n=1 Tax=Rhodococcus sp. OK302 TaxID=1882769 RepID=UPI000B940184|nr:hypothetical protein [Rhodococcus sp. OK302]NMM86631.1 hypothetical protein [Rhodococcus sp. SRB_17]OYD68389.1 hypothetical protein BDB13_1942 [Rhodococcus sp. OK302]